MKQVKVFDTEEQCNSWLRSEDPSVLNILFSADAGLSSAYKIMIVYEE